MSVLTFHFVWDRVPLLHMAAVASLGGFPGPAVGIQGLAIVTGFAWVLETQTQVTCAWQVALSSELSP